MKFDNVVRDGMRKAHAAAQAAHDKAETAFRKPHKGWDISVQHNGRDVFTMKASKVIKLALASKR